MVQCRIKHVLASPSRSTSNILLGKSFVYSVVMTLMANAATWSSRVIFLTCDEYGGFDDHVDPPPARANMGSRSAFRSDGIIGVRVRNSLEAGKIQVGV
jgi:phospholipase C